MDRAEVILIAHQRLDSRRCLCGWGELGRSHAGHQVAALREAGLLLETTGDGLRDVPADTGSIRMEHVADCCCRYVASPADTNDVKLIDTRCIAAYLVPEETGSHG